MLGELIIDYAAGTLGPAGALVVSSHLAMRPAMRRLVADAETAGGALLEAGPGEPLEDRALKSLLPRLEKENAAPVREPAGSSPDALAALLGTAPLESLRWRFVMPGMAEIALPSMSDARGAAKLVRLRAGKAIPHHGHDGPEMTLVLKGAFADTAGRYGPGDLGVADEETEHSPLVEAGEDCVCLVAQTGSARLRRPFRDLVRYLLS